jgi:ribonuclease BN (tRNA processing enzyme)
MHKNSNSFKYSNILSIININCYSLVILHDVLHEVYQMCEIIFLGTGGGRINLINQFRKTGGFLIRFKDVIISVDPGPGALSQLHSLGIAPSSINCVICSHLHLDHTLEAPLLIEAMSGYMLKKGGILIASDWTLNGDEYEDRVITRYHQSKLEQKIVLLPNQETDVQLSKTVSINLRAVPVKHEDLSGFGFVMQIGKYKIGYTSDTEYIPKIHDVVYAGLDLLIANCIKPNADKIPGHLNSSDLAKLLSKTKPKVCIITHLGIHMLNIGPSEQAKLISKKSGIKTIAAQDDYCYNLNLKSWGSFKK